MLRSVRLLNNPDRLLKDSRLRAAREWKRAEEVRVEREKQAKVEKKRRGLLLRRV